MTTIDDILAHHGIKGMHWGVRRSEGGGGRVGPESHSQDAKTAATARAKIKSSGTTKTLSNEELRTLVNRMGLEQQYSRMTSGEGTTMKRGHDRVKTILSFASTAQQIHSFANSGLGKELGASLKSGGRHSK